MNAYLILANGMIFEGEAFGAKGVVMGETVFTTGMNGYLETLTDPSFYGQIVTQTFPLIGNYGVIPKDFESGGCHVRAYIVRDMCEAPSNFRCEGNLNDWLTKNNIIGLKGIDTRALTKVLRESGVMNGMIVSGDSDEAKEVMKAFGLKKKDSFSRSGTIFQNKLCDKAEEILIRIRNYTIVDAVKNVTGSASFIEESADEVFMESSEYRFVPVKSDGTKIYDQKIAMKAGKGKKVVLWDFGAKANIRRELLKRGLEVITVSGLATAKDIMALNPDGIMLSNGPGDPKENIGIISEIKKLIKAKIPIFGICLGHQLLALASGADTEKLKYGHRGPNQPVKYLETGRVYISTQNHGYAVKNDSLPKGAKLSFINTNDGTCEGIRYIKFPAFSVQFHPEACAGPLDTSFLFDDFVKLINETGRCGVSPQKG